jgi:hypothetical protein
MPKRSRRSERAKLQRASGKLGFDSGFVEDAFDKLQDPDFELDLHINDEEDSDEEIPVGGFNFSVAGEEIKTESDTDESESETDGLDESGDEDYEDQVVIKSVVELEEHVTRRRVAYLLSYRTLPRLPSFLYMECQGPKPTFGGYQLFQTWNFGTRVRSFES